MPRLTVLDSTLRDGAQAYGVAFRPSDKVIVADVLDELGVDYIEGGMPGANETDTQFFALMRARPPMHHARLCAFCPTCRPGQDPAHDELLLASAACGAPCVTVFGKAYRRQVESVLQTTTSENLRMIHDTVSFFVRAGMEVLFDAEHFFDGYQEDAAYALSCLDAAYRAGAKRLVMCDTRGGAMMDNIRAAVQATEQRFPGILGFHGHNDAGLADACAMTAVLSGVTHVQGTIGGIGERCGNNDLCVLLPNLALKLHADMACVGKLSGLTRAYHRVCDVCNLSPRKNAPYVGRYAFAHKAGTHIDGMLKDAESYEQSAPEAVGNARRLLVSDQTGRSGAFTRLQNVIPDLERDSPEMNAILRELKLHEARGYRYESAAGSFELMALKTIGRRPTFYTVLGYHVLCEKAKDDKSAQAHIKLRAGSGEELIAAEGDGPVNALDKALRKALAIFYPCLSRMRLVDFKVRVIDTGGTASTVSVQIESTDGEHVWATTGVSPNIISACFRALTDSVDYMLLFYASDKRTE